MAQQTGGGMGKEAFWKSRRVWASTLTLLATISLAIYPLASNNIEVGATLIAGLLGLSSWVFPKK